MSARSIHVELKQIKLGDNRVLNKNITVFTIKKKIVNDYNFFYKFIIYQLSSR